MLLFILTSNKLVLELLQSNVTSYFAKYQWWHHCSLLFYLFHF